MTKSQDLEASFKKINRYQYKVMEEQQKTREADLKAREQAMELQQLTKQVQDMQRAHLRMDQQHKEQMEKVKQEIEERHALELQGVRVTRMKNKLSVTDDDNFPVIEYERLDFPTESYLGHGGFAAVAKAHHRDWKQDVAVKRLLPQPTEGSERPLLYSEARKLNLGGRSTCIVSLLGVCLEPHFAIVMPYMENGSLAELLRDVDVPWALRWRMAHEISLGMTFLHCQNPQILHCDLKSENVLLDEDFHVKISDFGLSKWKTTSRVVTSTSPTGATITHAPPEFIIDINSVPNSKFDVYSFGVLLWEIITRRKPYENAMNSALIELAVKTGQRPDLKLVPTNVPEVGTVSQLMQTCWSQNAQDRPTFQGEHAKFFTFHVPFFNFSMLQS
ncbi:receptor-interacting serine/threonine-protein kinase 2-like [Branchiostoma lanceolatum]|uniref:receptor-interacting serine/threonine-protein kinase 2-like n=1 Tax=Branchiostoma lanceolatum TaxID=7740 RepID=UPI00345409F1